MCLATNINKAVMILIQKSNMQNSGHALSVCVCACLGVCVCEGGGVGTC